MIIILIKNLKFNYEKKLIKNISFYNQNEKNVLFIYRELQFKELFLKVCKFKKKLIIKVNI